MWEWWLQYLKQKYTIIIKLVSVVNPNLAPPHRGQVYLLQPSNMSFNQLLILIFVLQTQQFQAVFQKRLSEHLGAPNSPKREAYRKKTQPSLRRKGKVASSRRRSKTRNTTIRPPSTSGSPPQRMLTFQSWPLTSWKAQYLWLLDWTRQVRKTDADCCNINSLLSRDHRQIWREWCLCPLYK